MRIKQNFLNLIQRYIIGSSIKMKGIIIQVRKNINNSTSKLN